MRLAVIQHARRETAVRDVEVLLESLLNACSRGADVVVLPAPAWLSGADLVSVSSAGFLAREWPHVAVLAGRLHAMSPEAASSDDAEEVPHAPSERGARIEQTSLGHTVQLAGDECLDSLLAAELYAVAPDAIILRPGSESDLQAEAMLERALALSESVSGLVIIAEADGDVGGAAGHGGSAIVALGEVLAEAMAGDDVITTDVDVPVPGPESRPPVPEMPPILAQRWALHHGQRVTVEYPADLT